MKKSDFIALLIGVVSGVIFSLGMCMILLPEWGVFTTGVIFGSVGLVLGLSTFLIWCKKEHKKMLKISGKNVFRILHVVIGVLVLGTGMCMCLVWNMIEPGVIVGVLGIVMLLCAIPMIKGIY